MVAKLGMAGPGNSHRCKPFSHGCLLLCQLPGFVDYTSRFSSTEGQAADVCRTIAQFYFAEPGSAPNMLWKLMLQVPLLRAMVRRLTAQIGASADDESMRTTRTGSTL